MFSRNFDYKGYDGLMHTETWWFNLNEAELYEMELGNVGGVNGIVNRLLREEQPGKVVDMFKAIILKAVGEKSLDGRRFIKKERPGMPWGDVAEDFKETPAYAQLFIELVSSGEKFTNFLKGAIPEEVALKLAELEAANAADKTNATPALQVVEGKPDET